MREDTKSKLCWAAVIIGIILSMLLLIFIAHKISDNYIYQIGDKEVQYVESGECFHKESCSHLNKSLNIKTVTIFQALSNGKRPCTDCEPAKINNQLLAFYLTLILYAVCTSVCLIYFTINKVKEQNKNLLAECDQSKVEAKPDINTNEADNEIICYNKTLPEEASPKPEKLLEKNKLKIGGLKDNLSCFMIYSACFMIFCWSLMCVFTSIFFN